MKTKQIISDVKGALERVLLDGSVLLRKVDFDFLEDIFDKNINNIKKELPDGYSYDINDMSRVAKIMVMNSIFSHTQSVIDGGWNKDYVREKYTCTISGIDFIYYPARNPKNLLITFSSMGRNSYDRYSRYYDTKEVWDTDTSFIFFKDEENSFFLGTEGSPMTGSILRIIKFISDINKIPRENIFTSGSSMGGYAAIYYSIEGQCGGALVYAPQINKKCIGMHEYRNWDKYANLVGTAWIDLDIMIHRRSGNENLYIEYGNYPADLQAASIIKSQYEVKKKGIIISSHLDIDEHTKKDCLQKDDVLAAIKIFTNTNKNKKG